MYQVLDYKKLFELQKEMFETFESLVFIDSQLKRMASDKTVAGLYHRMVGMQALAESFYQPVESKIRDLSTIEKNMVKEMASDLETQYSTIKYNPTVNALFY